MGLRNPWRFSFDDFGLSGTDLLIEADVGQDLLEEIDVIDQAGLNLGWRITEGSFCFNVADPANPLPTCDVTGSDASHRRVFPRRLTSGPGAISDGGLRLSGDGPAFASGILCLR